MLGRATLALATDLSLLAAACSSSDTTPAGSLNLATGAFTGVGSATCSVNATADAAVAATTISGTLFETFAQPCIGTVSDVSTQSEALALTKQ